MTAYVNYPLTTSDDDEFFDAPPGSFLLNSDGQITYKCVNDDFGWETSPGTPVQAGAVWSSLFADGNPFGDHGVTPGTVLRVPLEWAKSYGLAADRAAAEAEAEARVAAWMAAAQ